MADYLPALGLVFSTGSYAQLFLILLIALIPFYAILTDMVVLSPLSPNPSLKPLEASLILIVAILASLGFTIAAFQLRELHSISRKSAGGSILGAGAGGSVLAAFATTCAICQPVWLVWLGLGSASVFLTDYSLYIALASILVLLYSITCGLRSISACGRLPKKGKK